MNEKALIIVPACNEAENIASVVRCLENTGYDYIVINDGSTDNTESILCELGANHISLLQNLGIGGAVQTGYRYAMRNGYDIAIQFDGDGQHDAKYIEEITRPITEKQADLVVGSRFVGDIGEFKSSLLRRFGINVLSKVLKLSSGQKIYDVTSGFRAAGKEAIRLFSEDYPDDYPEPESIAKVARRGMRIVEVPVVMHERQGGTSSIGGLDSVYYMVKVSIAIFLQMRIKGRR